MAATASVSEALHQAAQRHPHGVATVTFRGSSDQSAAVTTTYAALHQQATSAATALHGRFFPRAPATGQRLALLCRNHELALTYLFATAALGLVAVPLNTRWGTQEMTAALRDCAPAVVVCDAELWPLLQTSLDGTGNVPQGIVLLNGVGTPQLPVSSSIHFITHEELLRAPPPSSASSSPRPTPGQDHDLHCLVYTSGSTGEPKGVMLSHGAQMTQAREKVKLGNYAPTTVYLSLAPLFHVAGLNSSIAVTLAGGTHVFVPPHGGSDLALQAIKQQWVNTLVVVPTMLAALVAGASKEKQTLDSITFVLVGGQAMTPDLWERAKSCMPKARFVQSYACSEACSSISFLALDSAQEFPPLGMVGQARSPIEVGILELLEEAKEEEGGGGKKSRPRRRFVSRPGTIGEIATRGPHLMHGYWRRPEATQAVLVHPIQDLPTPTTHPPPQPWLCTGDVGLLDAHGTLRLVGRLADVIRSGGEKIMASEVERALTRHPRVAEAAVVGMPDATYGERPVAVVVLFGGGQGQWDTDLVGVLQAHCRKHLAGYKVPKEIHFVPALPLTGSGKVRKAAVAAALREKRAGAGGVVGKRSFL